MSGLTPRTNVKRKRRKNLLIIGLEKIPSEETPEGIVKEMILSSNSLFCLVHLVLKLLCNLVGYRFSGGYAPGDIRPGSRIVTVH